MAQVDGAENGCLTQLVEQVGNMWYEEHIKPRLIVETMIISTHA